MTSASDELRTRLERGRTPANQLAPAEGVSWAVVRRELLRRDWHNMAAEYHDRLSGILEPGAFALWVFENGISAAADAGRWGHVAAKMFYLLEEVDAPK